MQMFKAYMPKITLSGSETRKGDGIGMRCGGQTMLFDGFEGGEPTNNLMSWLAGEGVEVIDTVVLSHIHYDHYNGLLQIGQKYKIKLLYMYDPLTLKHGCDCSANGRAVKEDMDNAYKFIRKMQSYGTRVLWLDKGATIKCGDVSFRVWRKQPTEFQEDEENGWAFVNDGSLILWSPETQLLLGGDGPTNIKEAIAYFGAKVSGYDISHHGNNCSMSNAQALKAAGCVVAWESNVERDGAGTTDFTMYGARRVVQQGIPVWMQDAPIYITAAKGKIVFRQGDKTISKAVPYSGEGSTDMTGTWEKGSKGWWYKYPDGSYATGWALLPWSGGKDWFYFDSDGWMQTGWKKLKWSGGESWFFFDFKTGAMKVGWNKLPWGDGKEDWFLLDPKTGAMLTGWQWSTKDGKTGWYYLDPKTGAMKTGWLYDDGEWYCLGDDGRMLTGWVTYKGRKCYLEPLSDKNHVQGVCYRNRTAVIGGKTYRFDNDGYATEESGGKSFLNGVDIASYQSGINPAKLTTTDFVIVKFTQGTTYLNPYADRQYSVAKAVGKLLGAYHYAEGKNAKSEAQYFVKCLGNRVKECVLALDWEGNQNSVFGTGKDVAWCKEFLDEVYRLTGVRPLIYMSKSVCRKYNWSSVAKDYPLWCAQYKSNSITDYQSSPWTDNNGFGAWERDTIRQYSSHGRIAGYDANIDLDLAYMSAEEWRAMAGGKIQTEENPIDVAISIAESYLGYHEGANNKTIFGDTMHKIQPSNMDANAAWCDAFVDFVIFKTCEHFGKGAETARMVLCGDFDDYTYNSVALYKKAGRWSNTAHRGDQIFFGGSGHTGMVESVNGGTVHTIEGNKGDEVRRGSYSTSSPSIIGYGRPRYDLITGKITAADMPLVKKGSKGDAVKRLQEMLNAKGYKLNVDSDFGPATDAAVRAYQKANHLEVDGEVGPKTWSSLFA